MTNPLTLDALEVLDAIDRKGSFAAAALSLNKVPSAISYTMQKLEQDLAITLFQRQGRKSVLTSAGQYLLQQGRQLLIAANELAMSTQQVATGWEPQLRIAVDHLLPDDYLFPLIKPLYQRHPSINIDIHQEVLAGTWEALINNRVDLIIGAVAAPSSLQGIRSLPWQSIAMVMVAAPDHPACQQPSPLTDTALQQYRTIIVRDSSTTLRSLNRGISGNKHSLYVPNMAMKIQAHCQGLGVGSVPRHLVTQQLQQGDLIELHSERSVEPASTHIAWKTSNRGQALQWLVEQLQNQPSLA
ncbi:MAG: LysR substrate-binding domain-containing protein [Spongiibacteraceae bacterium]|jgi:DNA-binding transcriptional LysR family regulator